MTSNKSDFLIAVTIEEDIVKLSNTEDIVYLKRHENLFNDICMIYPSGKYFAALRQNKILNICQTSNGKLVGNSDTMKADAIISTEINYNSRLTRWK